MSPSVNQRGQAALLTVILVMAAVTAVIFTLASPGRERIRYEEVTSAAMVEAQEALIGYAASSQIRPGQLPCPDTDNDGLAETWDGAGACQTGYVGRLPWKTLGLPEPRDGSGEILWYAVSPDYARDPATCTPACAVNPDKAGFYSINGAPGFIAIIFAPGEPLQNQLRLAAPNAVASYLDGVNAAGGPAFVTVDPALPTFNDRLLAITHTALFGVVNQRVIRELRAGLLDYKNTYQNFPRANPYGAANYNCDNATFVGRLPAAVNTCNTRLLLGWGAAEPNWTAAMPSWFVPNQWSGVTHYAVSEVCGMSFSIGIVLFVDIDALIDSVVKPFCTSATGTIGGILKTTLEGLGLLSFNLLSVTVDGATVQAGAVLFVSGPAMTGQTHPCADRQNCLEAPNNAGGYQKPLRYPSSNDRMALICAPLASCAAIP